MAGSSNIQFFDVNNQNLASDAQYDGSTWQQNGMVSGVMPSAIMNKILYQGISIAYSLAQVLSLAGFSITDSNPTNTITAIQQLFTLPQAILYGYNSAQPTYVSATAITYPYLYAVDSTGTFNIIDPSPISFSTTTLGLSGIDTGSVGLNQLWYSYAVSDGNSGSGHNGVMYSQVNSHVTGLPATTNFEYVYYKQLDFAFTTDGSGNIIPFRKFGKSVFFHQWQSLSAPYNVYNAITPPGVWTAKTAGVVPAISSIALGQSNVVLNMGGTGGCNLYVRPSGVTSMTTGQLIGTSEYAPSSGISLVNQQIPLNSSQQFDIQATGNQGANKVSMDITGYIVTAL